ncbi:hypothetical protein AAZX31_17G073900 [Glycine max]|uniref:Class V chitinase isoform B n=1 Tax=Glycine soja TaxID=3848 RepID=A0A445G3K4_GLYSO|nr:Class V chitinase isoform B [Glycine soja]
MPMAYSKSFSFLISILLFIFHNFHVSTAQKIKGGYWFPGSSFAVSDINSTLYTHLFCAFADLNASTYQVTISSSNAPQFSTFTQTVQKKNPSVKTLLSIGGGASNPSTFSAMASQAGRRKTFIDSSIQLARSNNFHGLDMDWEYPSTSTDMTNYGFLIREWRTALVNEARNSGKQILLLVGAVFYSSNYYSLNYTIQDVINAFDFVNVMAYDFYGPNWYPNFTAPPAALYALNHPAANRVSGDMGIRDWIGSGMPASKLVLGVPFYGYAWRLLNSNNRGLFDRANGSAFGGDGSMGYSQIREFVSQNRAACTFNSTVVSDYCSSGTTWIGYDDVQSVSAKVAYAKTNNLGGHFVWHVGADYNWVLSQAGERVCLQWSFLYSIFLFYLYQYYY